MPAAMVPAARAAHAREPNLARHCGRHCDSQRRVARGGGPENALRPTTVLATDGIYKWTRNPLYTGGTLVMFGIALIFALDWLVLLIVPSALVLHFGVVSREEKYLEQKFGDKYRRYKISVARYGLGV
jgi:protein-S-isoprenylcysteine O-methyltransferase Ste14